MIEDAAFASETQRLPIVFTAQSKTHFYCRDAICEFVFSRGKIPINPFRVFDYFLGDRVERDLIRQANNNLIQVADEFWVFGDTIADGVFFEIQFAKQLNKPIAFFTIENRASEIREIGGDALKFEPSVYQKTRLTKEALAKYLLTLKRPEPEGPQPIQMELFSKGSRGA